MTNIKKIIQPRLEEKVKLLSGSTTCARGSHIIDIPLSCSRGGEPSAGSASLSMLRSMD